MKLKRKMSLFFIFALIVPVTIMLMILLNQNVTNIREVNKNEVEKTVGLVNKITKQELEKGFISLDYLKNIFLNEEGSYNLNNTLYNIRRNSASFMRVYILNEESGQVEVYPKDGKVNRDSFASEWYKKARSQNKLIYPNTGNEKGYVVTVSKSLVRNGKVIGVVAVDIDLELVFAELQNRKSKALSDYVILDNEGGVIFPRKTNLSAEFISELVNNDSVVGRTETFENNNKEIVSYYKEKVEGTTWVLAGTSSLSALKVTYNTSRNVLYVSLAIIGFLSIFSVFVFDNIMINPLVQVKEKFRQASTGNFGTRIFVDSNDEIGDLALEFNTLMKKINKKFRTIEEGISQGLTKSQIVADVELEEAMESLDDGIQFETMSPKYDFNSNNAYKKRDTSYRGSNATRMDKTYENISDLEEEAFDNPIVEEDENFKKHQRDLIHRTFDEWRTEYFKTLEEKKKTNVDLFDDEPEELV
mgnify:FL=1